MFFLMTSSLHLTCLKRRCSANTGGTRRGSGIGAGSGGVIFSANSLIVMLSPAKKPYRKKHDADTRQGLCGDIDVNAG